MFDRREQILLRLKERLAATIPEVDGRVYRNRRGIPPPEKLPAIVVLDGSERKRAPTTRHKSLSYAIYTLTPQIFILLRLSETIENTGKGEELSAMRAKVIASLTSDETLLGLLGENGEIEYTGHDTDMATGSAMQGEMFLRFTFAYLLSYGELA